jgi:hypothetical protein
MEESYIIELEGLPSQEEILAEFYQPHLLILKEQPS